MCSIYSSHIFHRAFHILIHRACLLLYSFRPPPPCPGSGVFAQVPRRHRPAPPTLTHPLPPLLYLYILILLHILYIFNAINHIPFKITHNNWAGALSFPMVLASKVTEKALYSLLLINHQWGRCETLIHHREHHFLLFPIIIFTH